MTSNQRQSRLLSKSCKSDVQILDVSIAKGGIYHLNGIGWWCVGCAQFHQLRENRLRLLTIIRAEAKNIRTSFKSGKGAVDREQNRYVRMHQLPKKTGGVPGRCGCDNAPYIKAEEQIVELDSEVLGISVAVVGYGDGIQGRCGSSILLPGLNPSGDVVEILPSRPELGATRLVSLRNRCKRRFRKLPPTGMKIPNYQNCRCW